MRSLHQIIDEHEKKMLQQILTIEQEGKKKIEDYKTPLKCELRNLNIQKATFEILLFSENQTKLLQAKQGFNDYINKTNGTIKSLQMPRRTRYCLEGLHHLQTIKDKITECGRCAIMSSYRNSELEKIINDHGTKQKINLKGRYLIDSDMTIVANVLQNRTV